MSDKAPPVNINSPVIQRAAEKAGLPTSEFIEYCVLLIIRIQELMPEEFLGTEGSTPWERLENLRHAISFFEKYRQLTPENKAALRDLFPATPFPSEEQP